MLTTVKDLVTSLSDLLKNKLEENNQQTAYLKALNDKQMLNYSVYSLMLVIQEALFDILAHRDIEHIKTIRAAADIRIIDYRVVNDAFIYIFEIEKKDIYSKVSNYALEQLRRRMNSDIYRRQQQIMRIYGVEFLMINYPLLYYGIYILKIKDVGDSLRLYVATHIQP